MPEALYNLGISYIAGRGIQKDTSEGIIYLRMSANKGFKDAQDMLIKLGIDN